MKSGFVAIIGRPNVGKSTMLNALLEHKISIVTNKAQTTRNSIRGIYDDDEYQIIFIDTPGIHKAMNALGRNMNKEALNASRGVDAIILVVDGSRRFDKGDEFIKETLPKNVPMFIVINKIDLITINEANDIKAKYQEAYPEARLLEMSAIRNFNIDTLLDLIKNEMKEGPRYFNEGTITDRKADFLIAEIIREKALEILQEEVPHSLAVKVTNIKEKKEAIVVEATLITERDSHKKIIIGKNGKRIKAIGVRARKDIEELYNKSCYLELFVSVKEDWLNSERMLKELGYKDV